MTEKIDFEKLAKELGLEDFADEEIEELDYEVEIAHLLEEAEEVIENDEN